MKIKEYFMYPVAYLGISVLMQSLVSWYAYFYAPPEGNPYNLVPLASVSLVGVAMIIGRVIDAISDPLVAYWSDNFKSRLGRRKPFLIFGAFPLVLSYILIWFPPKPYESFANFVYLAVMLSLYFIFFTIYVAPYLALLPEIATDSVERAAVSTYQSVFNTIGLLLQGVACPVLIARYGVRAMGVILGALSLITLIMPFGVKERKIPETDGASVSLKESLILTLKNREFMYYEISFLFYWFAINMVTIALPYIATVNMRLSGTETALLQGLLFIDAILISPFMLAWIKKYGKKKVYNASMTMFMVLLFVMFFVGRPYLFLASKWFGFLVVGLAGFPLAAVFIIPNAIIADITDIDEAITGRRREAMFFGVQGLLVKTVTGLSSFFTTGVLFKYLGYSFEKPSGIYASCLLAAVCILLGLMVFRNYSLDEGSHTSF
ncbi:putative 2,3-dihydroxypropane-1-sulfonate exporter [Fervidicola ferrireducens]|uniref:Putative 2,3-dihydroxypropane-1-sulfonate exporter n=1 Tax=Fervidicola ferrireducens TaxID=520764 RepID=A0A140LE65_9FIRM|nr:MFS transporter [Fervidicola ferrireducens]KXG78840.1 putative 2,3-dihydroxypropane-1-sulfonate exporter [Fervidicola ferrireducens]